MTKFKRQRRNKKASAILTADLHIRPDRPVCRTDEFLTAMVNKLFFITDLAKKNECPILVAGDIGHKPQWKNWVLEWIINQFKVVDIICIAGQHDLPAHRLSDWDKSGIGVLHAAGAINFIQEPTWGDAFRIYPFSWGQEITKPEEADSPQIAMTHQMIVGSSKKLWPGDEYPRSNSILKKNPGYNLILSGDNHIPFVSEYEGKILCNPGSMMRTTTIQENHRPRVYLWYADTNTVEAVYLPIEEGVISRDHIKAEDDRINRYDSFIMKMKEDCELELSFSDNMQKYLKRFRTENPVKDKINKCVGLYG